MKRPKFWLSYAYNEGLGAYIAIASTKHPSLGDDDVDVVASSFEPTEQACIDWFDRLCKSMRCAMVSDEDSH